MSRYLSIDIESTGLEDDAIIIEFGAVPVDAKTGIAHKEMAFHSFLKCPSFEDLKKAGRLSDWVIENNETLIRTANEKGVDHATFLSNIDQYFNSAEIKEFFSGKQPVVMGKSLTGIDIPFLIRDFGRKEFVQKYFYHRTVDISSVASAAVDAGKLPEGCTSSQKLAQHFGLGDDVAHTSIEDAIDVFKMYLGLLKV